MMMRSIMQDVCYALRQFRKSPGFALTVVAVLALGASQPSILHLVMSRALILVGIGLALGGVLAWFTTTLARGYIFGVQPHDGLTFAVVVFVLAASAFAAAWLPARRAAAVDPILALRSE